MTMPTSRIRSVALLIAAVTSSLCLLTALFTAPVAAGPQASAAKRQGPGMQDSAAEYTNQVYPDDHSPYADPGVIRGRDGFYYAYATGGGGMPITRSADLVNWEEVGKVFPSDARPGWVSSGLLWGPEVTYVGGQYVLTYTVANTPTWDKPNRAVGLATAPTPAGPWTDKGSALLEPQTWRPTPNSPIEMRSIMDTDLTVTPDGRVLLYYGGFRGGIWAVELSDDLQGPVGEPTKLISEHTYEAPFVMQRDGWYYLMTSSGRCCLGEVSGYTVAASRSRDPLGPFVDKAGNRMDSRRPGGTPVVGANGNSWTGVGANTVVSDLGGQDWMLYHGIDRHRELDPGTPIAKNLRPMLLDRLDWIDGWPTVRAGQWASDQPQTAPATDALIADAAEADDNPWTSTEGWQKQTGDDGGYWSTSAEQAQLVAGQELPADVHARAAVRLRDGAQAGFELGDAGVAVTVDAAEHALIITVPSGQNARADLPASLSLADWHELQVTRTGNTLTAELDNPRGRDVAARAEAQLSGDDQAGGIAVTGSTAADVDDVTVAPWSEPVTEKVPDPVVGELNAEFSDDFDAGLSDAWSWVRDAVGSVDNGQVNFPLQTGGIVGDDGPNSPSLLLRDTPDGDWTVETKLTLDFQGAEPDRYPMAGLIVHADDDNYVRLGHRAHGAVEHATFTKEMTERGDRQAAGLDTVAPPGTTTWLRLQHTTDPGSGDHVYRAAVSTDGQSWTWGMAYTLDAAQNLRVGLFAHGADANDGDWTPAFDYVRFFGG